MKWGYVVGAAALGLPFLALLASGFGKDPSAIVSPLPGHEAPDFTLSDLDGKAVRLSELRGAPVVINFWATWCIPCRQEHEVLARGAAHHAADGVQFLGVVYQDEPESIRRFLARSPVDYPTLVDVKGQTAIDYGVTGVPETFFVRPDGVIDSKKVGPLDPQDLERRLGPLLATGGGS
ncbi:TlpA family protein disulfide reductase [Myxococcota bacterium]|nr:TlpA family protein disulfide reductase [Myxococcota bacterium]